MRQKLFCFREHGTDRKKLTAEKTVKEFFMKRIKFFSFALALAAMALVSGGCDTGGDGSGGGSGGGETIIVPSSTLSEALNWLDRNAADGKNYIITLTKDETIYGRILDYNWNTVGVTIEGGATERIISVRTTGYKPFCVKGMVTLTLGNNVTLQGRSDNTYGLVRVEIGGTLVMQPGSKITGNRSVRAASIDGGGVCVDGGTFIMNGGEISGNSIDDFGGGVWVGAWWYYEYIGGVFVMNGGTISGNTAANGGGVYVYYEGTFTMNGGEISGNTATLDGGGVNVRNGTFTMTGGKISGNTVSGNTASGNSHGGGVYVDADYGSTFTKTGNSIIDDTNSATKGKVAYVYLAGNAKVRNTTAGPGVNLDSTKEGAAGGWE
jgi:hypothetical protein